jgi:predicted MFS family arabinose efflux permease
MAAQSSRPFFGWAVLFATGYSLMIGAGLIFYAMSVLLENIVSSTPFSVAQISTANTIFLLTSGFAGIAVSELISRFDIRYTICAGALVILLAFELLPGSKSLSEIYLCYVLIGLGYAMTALVPSTTLVARWFIRRRALALALTQSGLSLGGVVLTPIMAGLIKQGGLEAMQGPLPTALILGIIPLAILFMRPDPHDMGLHPDGDDVDPEATPASQIGMRVGEALKTRFFWWSATGAIFALATQVGMIAHVYNWALERADATTAASTLALMAFCSLTGRLICGAFLDRINIYPFVLTLYLLQAVSMLGIAYAEGQVMVVTMTILFGLTVGNILMSQSLLIGKAFGVRDFPRILSANQLMMNGGVALGPILIGLMYDFGGGYQNAFIVVSMTSILAFVALRLAGSPVGVSAAFESDASES